MLALLDVSTVWWVYLVTHLPGVATPGDVKNISLMQPLSLTDHYWSILLFLIFVSFPLNSLMVLEETQSSVSIFHLSMTRSEKKYLIRSVVQRCFISLTLCPVVDKFLLLSNIESKLGQDFPLSILNISIESVLFRLSSKVQRPSWRKRSLYGRTFIPGTIRVKRCCIFSNNCLSLE